MCICHTEIFVDNFHKAQLLDEITSAVGDSPTNPHPSIGDGDITFNSSLPQTLDNSSADSASIHNVSEGDLQMDPLRSATSEGDVNLQMDQLSSDISEGDSPLTNV